MTNRRIYMAMVGVMIAFAGQAAAVASIQPITVKNWSFEQPTPTQGQTTSFGTFSVGSITDWDNAAPVFTDRFGVFRPNPTYDTSPSPAHGVITPRDAIQVGWLSSGGAISQTLTDYLLTAGTTYTLQVDLGQRNDGYNFGGYIISLFGGGTLLKSDTGTTAPSPLVDGTGWLTSTIVYTPGATAPLGQPLKIEIRYNNSTPGGQQTLFDNVRLSASSPDMHSPEPMSLAVWSLLCLCGLCVARGTRARSWQR